MKAIQKEWVCRMVCELAYTDVAYFVTLTYDDDHIGDNVLKKSDVQRFIHSLRVWFHRNYDENMVITYFACGEYGRKENRAHYHIMLFGLPWLALSPLLTRFEEIWKKGFVKVQRADIGNIHYICKYMTKLDPRIHAVKPFTLYSRRPSLGLRYWTDERIRALNVLDSILVVRLPGGFSYKLPRLWKNRFLTDRRKYDLQLHFLRHFESYASSVSKPFRLKQMQDFSEREFVRLKKRFHNG